MVEVLRRGPNLSSVTKGSTGDKREHSWFPGTLGFLYIPSRSPSWHMYYSQTLQGESEDRGHKQLPLSLIFPAHSRVKEEKTEEGNSQWHYPTSPPMAAIVLCPKLACLTQQNQSCMVNHTHPSSRQFTAHQLLLKHVPWGGVSPLIQIAYHRIPSNTTSHLSWKELWQIQLGHTFPVITGWYPSLPICQVEIITKWWLRVKWDNWWLELGNQRNDFLRIYRWPHCVLTYKCYLFWLTEHSFLLSISYPASFLLENSFPILPAHTGLSLSLCLHQPQRQRMSELQGLSIQALWTRLWAVSNKNPIQPNLNNKGNLLAHVTKPSRGRASCRQSLILYLTSSRTWLLSASWLFLQQCSFMLRVVPLHGPKAAPINT